jgi:hypothetical protein
MTVSVLDKRPAKAATALHSSPPPSPLPGEQATQASSERPFWILGAVVAVVTFAVFLPSVRNGWVNWDDADNFLGNSYFRGLGWDNLRWIFAFATVVAWLEACRSGAPDRPARCWYWTAVGCFAAALLSKVMVVGLPIVLVVLDVYPLRRMRAGAPRAVALLPDDVTAGGRARRLAMAMAPREPVTCAPGKRP